MPKLKIEVELSDHLYHAYERESQRKGEQFEKLVAKLVDELLREMEREVENPQIYLS